MDGFQIAEAYVDIKARNLMADALSAAMGQIRGVGAEAEAVGAKSSATGLLGSKAFLAIGAAAAGGAVEVVKMAGDFQASTERLITSAGESRTNIGLVRDGILAMAGAVGYSAEELSAAMYKIESGGQHGADGLKVLQAAAQGAKEENANLVTVSDAVTSAMQDYHLKATDAATVTSKLVAATSSGKMTFEELAGSMSAILPVASANHVSLNDILGDLASMTVHGESAQQAAQNLANAVRSMSAPNAVASKELAALGINATDLSSKLGERGLSGTMQLVSQAILKNMGPGATLTVTNLSNALKGLPPAVQDLGQKVLDGTITMKQFSAATKAMDPITASQAKSFETLAAGMHGIGTEAKSGSQVYQSYTQALSKATGGATGLNVALMLTGENSDTTAKAIKTVTDATANADGSTRGWADIQGTFNQKISEAKAGLGAFAIQIGTIALPAVTKIADAIVKGTDFLTKHKDAAKAAALVIGGVLTASFLALGAAVWVAIAPFVPLGIAVTGAIAIGYELISHWGDIKKAASDIWNSITKTFHDGVNAVIGLVNGLVGGADTVLGFLHISLIPHIPALAGGGTVGKGFMTNGPRAIVGEGNPNHPEYVIPTDPAHRNNALALYQSLGTKLMAGGGIIDWIGSTVSKVEKWVGDGASGLMSNAVDGLAGSIPAPFHDIATSVGHSAVAAIKALIDKSQQVFSAAFTGSPNLAGWIQAALGLTGAPSSWAGPLSVLVGRESGGNPNAINLWDSNAAAGHPSQGLAQVIPGTFQAYHQAGTSWNILDPVANLAAAINYIKSRYGSIFSVQQANPNLPAKGYDAGGLLPTGLSMVRNSTGQPERVLNATQTAKLDRLLSSPGRGAGGVTVNVTQVSGSPAETGRFVALALRTVA